MNTKRFLSVAAIAIVVMAGLAVANRSTMSTDNGGDTNIACSMEAKACPDGSYVARSGPNCEFAQCPTSSTTPTPTAGAGKIVGSVTTGPTCPVERIPPDPQCAPRPYQTTIQARKEGNNTVIATTQSNTKGAFQITLQPGVYELQATGAAVYPRCSSITITVKTGSTVVADISCDSGIR